MSSLFIRKFFLRSTIVRLTNEAKSTLSDREKKQEKILLSPITTTNLSTTKSNFDFNNIENDNGLFYTFSNKNYSKVSFN